ncbi:hypothetical protein [Micromonospora sp. DT47]|uniref:hypothetical protein n=1 Tax=Micromonospora sp. DT47 TaxID=3393431 RepID=UPI003CF97552
MDTTMAPPYVGATREIDSLEPAGWALVDRQVAEPRGDLATGPADADRGVGGQAAGRGGEATGVRVVITASSLVGYASDLQRGPETSA